MITTLSVQAILNVEQTIVKMIFHRGAGPSKLIVARVSIIYTNIGQNSTLKLLYIKI